MFILYPIVQDSVPTELAVEVIRFSTKIASLRDKKREIEKSGTKRHQWPYAVRPIEYKSLYPLPEPAWLILLMDRIS